MTDAVLKIDGKLIGSVDAFLEGSKGETFMTGLRSGNTLFLNSESEHEAAFMLLAIASNDSSSRNSIWLDSLVEESKREVPTRADVVMAYLTQESFVFPSGGNFAPLDILSKSANPIYRNLAANLAQRSFVETEQLVSFYASFFGEDMATVNESVILGLRKCDSRSALVQLNKMAKTTQVSENEKLRELASDAIDYLSQ